jgi:hypothetical protein
LQKDAEIGKAILKDITDRLIAEGLLVPEQLKFGFEKVFVPSPVRKSDFELSMSDFLVARVWQAAWLKYSEKSESVFKEAWRVLKALSKVDIRIMPMKHYP